MFLLIEWTIVFKRKTCYVIGCGVICVHTKPLSFKMQTNSFKAKWLTNLLSVKDMIWNTFLKHVLPCLMGGVTFLLKCDYKTEKLPVKCSSFHKQALLVWNLVCKHNVSPTSQME